MQSRWIHFDHEVALAEAGIAGNAKVRFGITAGDEVLLALEIEDATEIGTFEHAESNLHESPRSTNHGVARMVASPASYQRM